MPARTVFITGTDTGVGKTYVACLLLRQLRSEGFRVCGFKPISAGDREDSRLLIEASGAGDPDVVNPIHFKTPAAPMIAETIEKRRIDRGLIESSFHAVRDQYDWVVIEGAGGWEVPISETETLADLAVDFAAPVVVVAANRLGALNHTLLTCAAIRNRRLECAGVVLNEQANLHDSHETAVRTNLEALTAVLVDIPVIPLRSGEPSLDQDFLARLGI